jgi:putative ABC transport system substrate-binding protein
MLSSSRIEFSPPRAASPLPMLPPSRPSADYILSFWKSYLAVLAMGVTRIAVLWNPANSAFQKLQLSQIEAAAHAVGLELQLLEASTPGDFERAFGNIASAQTKALAVLGDPLFTANADSIAKSALGAGLVTVSNNRVMAQAGILLNYGPSLPDLHRRASVYVDKILKGAIPSDLPVEQPTTFELIVNVKAARTLGVTVPATLLAAPMR